jgi:hypothetical protein
MRLLLRKSSIAPLWLVPAGLGAELPCGAGRALWLAPSAARGSCGTHRDAPPGGRPSGRCGQGWRSARQGALQRR